MSLFDDGGAGQDPATSSTATTSSGTPSSHVHYAVNIGDTVAVETAPGARPGSGERGRTFQRNDTNRSDGVSPVVRRRSGRTATFMTVEDFEDFQARPGWHPGDEPGVDPSKPDGGHASMPPLSAPCQITIVDFSPDRFAIRKFDNATLEPFMKQPQPAWVTCRWINVNGLSWDVIQVLGRHKNLHNLAIEDIMNTRNRTKAEWYPTHAFMVLTLQKLVHICESDSEDSESETESDDEAASPTGNRGRQLRKGFTRRVQRLFRSKKQTEAGSESGHLPRHASRAVEKALRPHTGFSDVPDPNEIRTLQQYHGVPNDPRTLFMEKHSPLSTKELAVTCEQVSMFINQDNSIISFFELSAHDVEGPIVRRLETSDTILRQSCDASMVGQAIIDAIIDLAIPVTACYGDVIRDLELDVLTRPTLDHTKSLYIVITEINKMLSLIAPIVNLINTLRDHKTSLSQDAALRQVQDPNHAVIITPMTYTYLGDVLDHCVLISDSLNQLKNSADGMIGLIFNTITTYQNESMKQLTVATIIFLPLTFLTGYFGQNFHSFPAIDGSINYFWLIAVPVEVAVILVLLKDILYESFKSLLQRRYVLRLRKSRRLSLRRRKMKRT